jgi:hypothetical protein
MGARAELTHKWRSIGVLAVSGVVGFNSMLYVGLQHTTALSAAMIFSITPLLIMGLSAWVGRTRISVLQTLAGLGSVTRALIVLGGGIKTLGSGVTIGGNVMVLLSCFVWAAYCVAIKTCRISASSGSILLASVICGLLIQLPLAIGEVATDGLPQIGLSTLIAVAYLGLGAAALGFLVWQFAVGHLGPTRCGVFLNLVPVFGIFMSMGCCMSKSCSTTSPAASVSPSVSRSRRSRAAPWAARELNRSILRSRPRMLSQRMATAPSGHCGPALLDRRPVRYATPTAGYSSRRPNPAPVPTGSANVSATASHSSGDFSPRARMWSFASSLSREFES